MSASHTSWHLSRPLSWYQTRLALLRLLLLFTALCLIFAQLDIAQRLLHNQTVGLNGPLPAPTLLPSTDELPFLGINADLTSLASEDYTQFLNDLRSAGFGWVRLSLAWNQVEPSEGNFDWRNADKALEALTLANLVPVLVLDGTPQWARAPTDATAGPYAPPANPGTFARFAQAVATRYGDRVQFYQIWDEPNIAPHWGTRHIEAVSYARLLKAASTAIRDADPNAFILLAALAPTKDRGHLAQDEVYFLNRLYAAGVHPYFDAVAIQPFGFATHPDDPRVDTQTFNFRRTLWIRQAMVDAGDGRTPIWIVRYGWNRTPDTIWKSVSAQSQRTFAIDVLEMAYTQWPWVMAQGWAAVLPFEPASDTTGFALTPDLTEAFSAWSTTHAAQPRPATMPAPTFALWRSIALWQALVFWLLALLLVLWRSRAAATRLPWHKWQAAWLHLHPWQRVCGWALLLIIYYFAMWPPLILLCWVIAALGFLAEPRMGLVLVLVLLPFHDYHKELTWLGWQWAIPPAQATLLSLLPALWHHRPKSLPRDRWLGLAIAWLAVMALSSMRVWNWPAYWHGMLDLVLTPLLLFVLIRSWATTHRHTQTFITALAVGGVLVAIFGLIDWLQGGGTPADGLRRLTGPNFSANQTALYLIRTLFITSTLALTTTGKARWSWYAGTLAVGLALFLTGSRGALLLGVPAGSLLLLSRRNLTLPPTRTSIAWLTALGMGCLVMAWTWRERLANLATMAERFEGWRVAYALWLNHVAFGVGPNGFWWHFPTYIALTSKIDPNFRHPHNVWLEFATSGGAVALLWLLITMALLYCWVQVHHATFNWLQLGLLAALVASLAHAQVDAFQALPDLAAWNWVALALLLAFQKDSRGEE